MKIIMTQLTSCLSSSFSSSSIILYLGPSTSSYWPLRTLQMKKNHAARPAQMERNMRARMLHMYYFNLALMELPTTLMELNAMAAAAKIGCRTPATASGTAVAL